MTPEQRGREMSDLIGKDQPLVKLRLELTAAQKEIERLTTENRIIYRALDRISRSVAGSPHLVRLAREALAKVLEQALTEVEK